MANAPVLEAPIKKTTKQFHLETCERILKQVFDTEKKYVFQLASQNLNREIPVYEIVNNRSTPITTKKFKPLQNIVLTSQIVWPEGLKDPWSGKERKQGRYVIRYYDGCSTLFVDDQPQDRVTIDQFIKQTQGREFLNGKFALNGYETTLLQYMYMCSWNGDSPFRTASANTIFIPVDRTKIATQETERLDLTERALELAKNASDQKMLIHADFLGIDMKDWDSDNPLTSDEIRAEYRKRALQDADGFIKSYGNKAIEIKYYISKSLETGVIDVKSNPNLAVWGTSKNKICDIHGLQSHDAITEKIFEHSQLKDGEEFLIQLKAIYETK